MSLRLPSRADLRELLALALPIVGIQVGLMFMGVVDTVVVGRVSATALAAVALGNLYFFTVLVLGMGTLFAVDPLVSQGVGAGDRAQVERAVQRALVLAGALSLLAVALSLPARAVLSLLGQPADVVPIAASFVRVSIPGAFPFYAFIVLRQTLQAMRRTRPIVVTIVAANVANVVLNLWLVFGGAGVPPLGAVGSALATTISRWLMLGCLLALAGRELLPLLRPLRREALDRRALAGMLVLGVPIGVQMGLEFGVFAVIALLMGRIGTEAMAGHQIAINLASLTFMVPLGVSGAAAVLVGHAIGRGDPDGVRRAAAASLATGAAFMTLSATAFTVAPGWLARWYTSEPGVVAVAAALIPLAGVFQVFDGIQVVSTGVLRGAGDTRAPMIINVLGFWLLGFPVSLWLGFGAGHGPVGLWWGLVAGLAAVAAFLVLRVRRRLARGVARVRVEAQDAPAP
jgi:MATE family multidrug resistance protein